MKSKIIILTLGGLLAGGLSATAQETPAAAPTTATPPEASAQSGTESSLALPSETARPTEDAPIIPLIVMDEVPLTDAIKNLARQASLNYMLDPKITFGQPGPDGNPAPQPTISIRWENITAEQALAAMLNNYNLQIVQDPKTHIARVTVKDPAALPPLIPRVIQLRYTSPSNILGSAKAVLIDPRSRMFPDVRTSQLVVLATEKEHTALDEMITRLDLPTRQVLIEARLLETSMNPHTIKGINWSGTLEAQNVSLGNNLQANKPEDAVNNTLSSGFPRLLFDTAKGLNPGTAFLDADGVSAVISFLNKNAEAKVISAPRTVTLDNEMATIDVVRQIPIITTSPSSANTPGSSSITYSNVGVILNVTPRISADDTVNLKVTPEVSRVFNKEVVKSGNQDNTVYTFDKRVLTTTVVIPSGNTLVLGGLVQDDTRSANTKVPGLGDLPLLGRAFRSDEKERSQNNLLIFITPTIVKDTDFQPTKTTFLQSPVPEVDNREWSAWDSGKPYDWSKPGGREPDFGD